jgi:putative transposase
LPLCIALFPNLPIYRGVAVNNDKKMEIAVFKFGIISEFVTGVRLEYGEKEKLIQEKISKSYTIPNSTSTRIAKSTIKKWILDYKNAGNKLEGLMPSFRKDQGNFRSLDESLQLAIKAIKEERPELTGVALVNELRHRKYIGATEKINLSVIYNFLKKHELKKPRILKDRRSFEANFPNEMWQSDVLHGPMLNYKHEKRKKSYLIAILDDNSRLIPHAQFYYSEKLSDFKQCLKSAIEKRGLPQKIYIDNGSCYKALNLEQVTASLGVGIAHTPPYTPQGRGKIERWFRYVRENFLPTCPKNITLDGINERLDDWIENYHNKIHNTTKQTPLEKYQKNMKCVRPAPRELMNYFRFIEFRRVKKDRTFQLNGTIFEGPLELIDQRVELKFHKESPEDVEVFFDGKSFGKAILLDKGVNFKIGRNQKIITKETKSEIIPGELFKNEE